MLVYGDVERIESPHALRASIADALALAEGLPQGLARHAELSRAFIRASELAAGIADAEFAERDCDHRSGRQESGARFLYLTAQAMSRSWYRGMRDGSPLPAEIWDLLRLLDYPAPVRTKRAEGFALYALYPESYLEAARRSGLGPDTRVLGIRSIGAALGALVAAALQAKPAITVRPVGHPFAREVSASRELTASVVAKALRCLSATSAREYGRSVQTKASVASNAASRDPGMMNTDSDGSASATRGRSSAPAPM